MCPDPEESHVFPTAEALFLPAEFPAAELPIRAESADFLPEFRRVIHVPPVSQFVSNHILYQSFRAEDQFPGKMQMPGRGAGAPSAGRTANMDPGHSDSGGGRLKVDFFRKDLQRQLPVIFQKNILPGINRVNIKDAVTEKWSAESPLHRTGCPQQPQSSPDRKFRRRHRQGHCLYPLEQFPDHRLIAEQDLFRIRKGHARRTAKRDPLFRSGDTGPLAAWRNADAA